MLPSASTTSCYDGFYAATYKSTGNSKADFFWEWATEGVLVKTTVFWAAFYVSAFFGT